MRSTDSNKDQSYQRVYELNMRHFYERSNPRAIVVQSLESNFMQRLFFWLTNPITYIIRGYIRL